MKQDQGKHLIMTTAYKHVHTSAYAPTYTHLYTNLKWIQHKHMHVKKTCIILVSANQIKWNPAEKKIKPISVKVFILKFKDSHKTVDLDTPF